MPPTAGSSTRVGCSRPIGPAAKGETPGNFGTILRIDNPFVGPETLVDSHALVGSCAQIGAGVHVLRVPSGRVPNVIQSLKAHPEVRYAEPDFVQTIDAGSLPNDPGVGDGFNRLRGVAPGCRWGCAKVFTSAGSGVLSALWLRPPVPTMNSWMPLESTAPLGFCGANRS